MAEMVEKFHRTQDLRIESHAYALEPGLALARSCLEPLQAILRAGIRELERLFDVGGPGEQRRLRGAELIREFPHRYLVEIAVVNPHALAVADDELVDRLGVDPAEPARALK